MVVVLELGFKPSGGVKSRRRLKGIMNNKVYNKYSGFIEVHFAGDDSPISLNINAIESFGGDSEDSKKTLIKMRSREGFHTKENYYKIKELIRREIERTEINIDEDCMGL